MPDDPDDANATPTLADLRYPLCCLALGDGDGGSRCIGPFATEEEAWDDPIAEDTAPSLRRCRRVTLDEIVPQHWWDDLLEQLNELANDHHPHKAWCDWEGQIVREREPSRVTSYRALTNTIVALSGAVHVEMFVCEGDE